MLAQSFCIAQLATISMLQVLADAVSFAGYAKALHLLMLTDVLPTTDRACMALFPVVTDASSPALPAIILPSAMAALGFWRVPPHPLQRHGLYRTKPRPNSFSLYTRQPPDPSERAPST
jgi:hypothetical protein